MKVVMKLSLLLLTLSFLGSSLAQLDNLPREETVIFDVDGGIIQSPLNFNWLVPGTNRNQGMHQAVWEPLFILNYETGEIQPWLAESFTTTEALDEWTLTLREGVTWSDGEPFNADDVVFTINLLLDDETQSLNEAANMQQWIESVEKIDDTTVQFNLKAPNPRFQLDYFSVRIWGGVVMLPEHVWADKDPFTFEYYDPDRGWPLGTGAYRLVSASENEFIYQRRGDWWGAEVGIPEMGIDSLPEPEYLVWVVTGTEENRVQLASAGELDSVMDVTLGGFEAMFSNNPNMIAWEDGMPFVWLDPCPRQMSINNDVAPWDTVDMRRALNHFIDRTQIIAVAYEGTTIPSRTMFVEYGGMMPYIEAMENANLTLTPEADVDAGRALVEANGYALNSDGFYEKNGEVLSLEIQAHEGFIEKRRIASVIVEQLRAAGIDASQRNVAGATWEDNKRFGNYEAVMDWDGCGSINEPWNSMNRFTQQFYRPIGEQSPGQNNHVRWNTEGSARYSEIVEEIGSLPLGDPQIVDMVTEAMTIWYDEMPFIPITQAKKLIPFDTTYWTGWPTLENNYNHPASWWMSTHQIIHNLEPAGN